MKLEEVLEEVLEEALREWNDFKEERRNCTFEDYNNFILEIYKQMKEDDLNRN